MKRKRRGRIVVLHLAARLPFAGVLWQLLHHLIGFQRLGLDVYYIEDHLAWCYDPIAMTVTEDPSDNVKMLHSVLRRFGFGDRWAFLDSAGDRCLGMTRERCAQLMREADAVVNLCGATRPREEHLSLPCMVYLETDPGSFQLHLDDGDTETAQTASAHRLFFSYGSNIGAPDCKVPAAGLRWHPTRPPVLLDQWHPGVGPADPEAFTTVGIWRNKGMDFEIDGDTYYWSKHVNFRKVLDVAGRVGQIIELATDLTAGPDYEAALAGGYRIVPAIPMSLDIDQYRRYISFSRGEFTVAKDIYARTRSGWFSDRTASYLAAGRPVVTQRTGFEKFVPEGEGLLGFDSPDEAVEAIRRVNADYPRHARAARQIAEEYFDSAVLLDEIAETIGL